MRYIFICFALALGPHLLRADSYDDIAKGLTEYHQKIPSKKVALFPFVWADGKTDIGSNVVSERLTTRIVRLGKLEVIERTLLNKVLAEQKLQITGVVSPESAKELGKILGVDAIITGTLIDIAGSVEVNARIISAETGQVLGAQYGKVPKDWGEATEEVVYRQSYFGLYLGPRFGQFNSVEVIRPDSDIRYSGFQETKSIGADLRYTRWESRIMGFAVDLGYLNFTTPSAEVTQEGTNAGGRVSGKVILPAGRFSVSGVNLIGWFMLRRPGKTIQPYFAVGPAIRFLQIKPSVFDKGISKTVGGGGFMIGFRVVQPGSRICYHFEIGGVGGGPINYQGKVGSVTQEETVQVNGGGMSFGINF